MIAAAGICLMMMTVGAPAPIKPPPQASTVDRDQATQFAFQVFNVCVVAQGAYLKDVATEDLLAGAIRGLYDAAKTKPPAELLQDLKKPGITNTELVKLLIDARVRLGNIPALSGPRSLFAAVNGLKYATDPSCALANPRVNSFVSVGMDFGIGIELDGVAGHRWSIYRIERSIAIGQLPATGYFGPVPKPEAVSSPANFPWRVRRVIPGSPAQRAGLKPGDLITHFNGSEITAKNADRMFIRFAEPTTSFDPKTGRPKPVKRSFQLKRGEKSVEVAVEAQPYTPESVFGVMRKADGSWDCMLDRERRIGYIRIGPIESNADERVGDLLDDLTKRGCRALILDLRWCPGGYVTPGTRIAGMFLKPNDVIAQVRVKRNLVVPNGFVPLPTYYRATAPFAGRFPKTPLLVLVGSETTGGGELIASALQGNRRCMVMGQRTVGRASIQEARDIGYAQLQFRVTTGQTLRPNGKPRGRLPTSKPTDDWGIRPDPGLEIPITLDLSWKLHLWADEHSLRPADSNQALPFDDPFKDPYRAAALAHLRKLLIKRIAN